MQGSNTQIAIGLGWVDSIGSMCNKKLRLPTFM